MLLRLEDHHRDELLQQPEHGMGYQIRKEERQKFVFLNAEVAFRLPSNSEEWIELMSKVYQFVRSANAGRRDLMLDEMDPYTGSTDVSRHGSFPSKTHRNEIFFRFTAFAYDWRINHSDNSVISGTYATTESDASLVPSGLAAVGRYALPNRVPASYKYELRPHEDTSIYCGNSAPAFGQAGGGVEILFDAGCGSSTAILPPISIYER